MRVQLSVGVLLPLILVVLLLVAMFLEVISLAVYANEGDFGGVAVNFPVVHDLQVMVVQLHDLAADGVCDEHRARGGDHMGAGPEAGLHGLGQEIVRRGQQVQIVGVVHPQLAVAHQHQQSLTVVAHGDVDGRGPLLQMR